MSLSSLSPLTSLSPSQSLLSNLELISSCSKLFYNIMLVCSRTIFFILGRIFCLCPQAQCHIAPSAKTEICFPISEKYSQIILNTYFSFRLQNYGAVFKTMSQNRKLMSQNRNFCKKDKKSAAEAPFGVSAAG